MSAATKVVNKFIEQVHTCSGDISRLGVIVPMPFFSEKIIYDLIQEYHSHVSHSRVIGIEQNVIVVGDLHGNIHNALQIFVKFGFPPKTKYLFLGNLIEFGEYSLETVSLIMAYNVLYPTSVYLIRGSTESHAIPIYNGLKSNIHDRYKSITLYNKFYQAFQVLPIGAIIFGSIFCCQPEIIASYSSVEEITSSDFAPSILQGNQAYDHLINILGKYRPEQATHFCNNSNIDVIIMGNCPDDRFFDQIGPGFFLSACSQDQACVLPIVQGGSCNIEVFDSPTFIERKQATFSYIKDSFIKSMSKKRIKIPQMESKPQLKLITAPQNRIVNPAKSIYHMNLKEFIF